MKKQLIICSLLVLGFVGCTTSQQTTSYNTLFSLETATKGAYDTYLSFVVTGTLPTNQVPQITTLFNNFQASMLVAESAVQYNTNAFAPTALIQESSDIINLINTINHKP